MRWDNQTEKERKAQITGFSINAGDRGYIRASIGMVKENQLLSILFPYKDYWKDCPDPKEYDFSEENYMKLVKLGYAYLVSVMFQLDVEPNEVGKVGKKMEENVTSMMEEAGWKEEKGIKIFSHNVTGLEDAVMWLNSVFQFFRLGMRLKEEKKNPKIYISW
jgi:hypothetical protein